MLSIVCDQATFILPFIADEVPYMRYWKAENHIPLQMLDAIVSRMKEVKEMLVNDIRNPELKPYIDRFDLHELMLFREHDQKAVAEAIKNDPVGFLYEHRMEVAALYDVFIQWSEIQLQCYSDDRMLNIQGPQ